MLLHRLQQMAFTASAVALVAFAFSPQRAGASSTATAFRPVSPEELKMTAEPLAPGAAAIILYREVYRDDNGSPPPPRRLLPDQDLNRRRTQVRGHRDSV